MSSISRISIMHTKLYKACWPLGKIVPFMHNKFRQVFVLSSNYGNILKKKKGEKKSRIMNSFGSHKLSKTILLGIFIKS